jgi:adenosylcobinamide-GDP ribazoletransferase
VSDTFSPPFSPLTTALRTLTLLPAPGRDAQTLAAALPWFPAVGALVGGALYGLMAAAMRLPGGGWPAGAAAAAVLGGTLLTRGLHLDGLADWADGFGGGRDRESTLRIMKDPSVGAFGTLALVGALLAKWVAFERLAGCGTGLWVVAACVAARTVQVDLAVWLPYARAEGGTAEGFVRDSRPAHFLAALALAAALVVGLCGPVGALALGAAGLAGRAFGWWCRRRVGGVTGDLLGAASELVETALLLICAAPGAALAAVTGWRWLLS